ncbi:hypothetical protein MMC25_003028 [Agyrium rufum]|nr:hypothetical protein [Agyrium rufum]
MGKNKRKGHPDLEEVLARPWCYYCERDFDDQKVLINHQKAKHFKCERCGRRLNTAGGLSVHMTQVHKETLTAIENALPNRSNLDVEIFGTEGIPQDVTNTHNQRVIAQYAQAEADRRAVTGNPAPGAPAGGAVKKPKFEAPSDIKKRLAEHKAKVEAEKAAGINSGNGTPLGAGQGSQSPAPGHAGAYAGSPTYAQAPNQYGPPPTNYPGYGQPYGPPQGNSYQQPPSFSQVPPSYGSPAPHIPTPHQYGPPPTHFSPPAELGFPAQPFHAGPPRAFGAGSPPAAYQQQSQYPPPHDHTPPQAMQNMPRQPSLSGAPGLPQRPSFGAPSVNAFQMQQLHQGQPAPPNPQVYSNQQSNGSYGPGPSGVAPSNGPVAQSISPANGVSASYKPSAHQYGPPIIVELAPATAPTPKVETPKEDAPTTEKKSKKDKDRATRLVYTDNEVSPEEKMAHLSRYAYVPEGMQRDGVAAA